mgnify:CR=1 FL=1
MKNIVLCLFISISIDLIACNNDKNEINENIELFIINNDAKIQHIFNDNRSRYAEIPLLTQPEIFIIWYGLEKYPFSITDNWDSFFDEDELEIVQNLWC